MAALRPARTRCDLRTCINTLRVPCCAEVMSAAERCWNSMYCSHTALPASTVSVSAALSMRLVRPCTRSDPRFVSQRACDATATSWDTPLLA